MSSAISVKNAAFSAVAEQEVTPIVTSDYNADQFSAFSRTIVAAARRVPSNENGGAHGHAGLVMSDEAWRKLSGRTNDYEPRACPAMPTFAKDLTSAEVAAVKADYANKHEAYYVEEGCEEGLKALITRNVPESAIEELADDDVGYANVTAKEMMAHLKANATATDVYQVDELLNDYKTAIDFDGEETLKSYFKELERKAKLLAKEGIAVSQSMDMVTILSQIKAQGDFAKETTEWEAKASSDKTWDAFKTFFSDADRQRRLQNKYSTKSAGSSNFGSANNVNDWEGYIKSEIARGLAGVAAAAEETINLAMQKQSGGERTRITAGAPSGSAALEKQIADQKKLLEKLTAENLKLKEGKGNNDTRRKRERKMNERCPHCNRWHPYIAVEKCHGYPGNVAPEGWKPAEA